VLLFVIGTIFSQNFFRINSLLQNPLKTKPVTSLNWIRHREKLKNLVIILMKHIFAKFLIVSAFFVGSDSSESDSSPKLPKTTQKKGKSDDFDFFN